MLHLIKEISEKIKKDLIDIRRTLHENPEFALEEFLTSKFIEEKLSSLDLDIVKSKECTGIIGILKGELPGKTLLIRADMDCLKINENTNLPFKSKNLGLMHACGHDAHMAWVLGSAMILSKFKHKIRGNIKFLFQPAEEVVGGAERMIKEGALLNPTVHAAIGAHVWPDLPSGHIGIKYGEMMAAPDTFTIKIIGKGGHGATPHNCIDPIAISCQVYTALQNIVSRHNDILDPLVISIGKIIGGSAPNIIPDEVIMEGTTRTFNESLRKELPSLMERAISGVVNAYGGRYDFIYDFRYPAVINNDDMATLAESTAQDFYSKGSVDILKKPVMLGEDFSFFQREVPGIFLAIGNKNESIGANKALHNSSFILDEDIIHNTAAFLSYFALTYLDSI